MTTRIRIPSNSAECNAYMNRTDNLQLTLVTPPSTYKWTTFHWPSDDSTQWTAYRTELNALFAKYNDPDLTGPGVRKLIKAKIKAIRAYDNDKTTGHGLLDLVGQYGTADDCLTFNVKRRTIFQQDPQHHTGGILIPIPKLVLLETKLGEHLLEATNPDTPDSKGIAPDMKLLMMFRYIGEGEPKSIDDFKYIGNVKRGYFLSKMPSNELAGSVKKYAWYYACYQSNDGTFGEASEIIRAEILLPSA